MFLHKFDILKGNLNGLFQKFVSVVPKLCAVTKLGDLTVRIELITLMRIQILPLNLVQIRI
jgi:hypothetical protein